MKKKFWIINQVSATTAEILLYGFIGQYEQIDDAAFLNDFRQLEANYQSIHIRINSGGGDVYKGLAIFNAIKNSKANTTAYIDGIAASMGAIIPLATNRVEMSKYARYMTHRVTAYIGGNADEMRNFATEVENLEATLASILAKRTGLTEEDAKKKYITNQDRWISAEQAIEEKLIDAIYDADPVTLPTNQADAQQLFNTFQKVFNIHSQKLNNMKALALLLGLPEDATEAQITAAINTLITEKQNAENAVKNANKAKAKSLVDTAINNKQLTEADRAVFEPLAEVNYEAAMAAINKIPSSQKPTNVINNKTVAVPGVEQGSDEEAKTFEDLLKKGKDAVENMKKNDFPKYKEMYEAYYNRPLIIND